MVFSYRCGDKVTRIEQSPLGSVFVCSFGSSRHGPGGCKRTYLSYRDMEAHIKHRHKKKEAVQPAAVQPMSQPQMITLTQPPPNLAQPPPQHQFMAPPGHMPPHGHMVNHPPPGIITSTNLPPPGLVAVSLQQGHVHTLQSNAITIQGNISTMQPNPLARPGPMPPMMQPAPPNALPPQQGHPIPGGSMSGHHAMIGTQSHAMPSHQQLAGAPSRSIRHGQPQPGHNPSVVTHVRPQHGHNPPVVSSKSHGNLISIPIQGSNNWMGQGQQQWATQAQGSQQQHHRPGQYNQ